MSKRVFVFGSNEAGVHGAGAAATAYQRHGARWGKCYGHHGDSFAIPTKDEFIMTMPLERIKKYVEGFIAYAQGHRKLTFKITRIGCGLAGLKDEDIAEMFIGAPSNCLFDAAWAPIFDTQGFNAQYWGTF